MPKIINIKNLLPFTLLLLLWAQKPLFAQSIRKMTKRGDAAFRQKNYYAAAKWYAAILYDSPLVNKTSSIRYPFQSSNYKRVSKIRQSTKTYLLYQLAESYRLYGHYKEAVPQYEQYIAYGEVKYPLARLWYGVCLLANDQPDKSISVLNSFLQNYQSKDSFTQKARQGIADGNFVIIHQSQPPIAKITKIPYTVSGDGSNFGLAKWNDSLLWFTSSRHELTRKNETLYPVRLYSVNLKRGLVDKIPGFPDELNIGTPSLSADGLTLYFTGWKNDPLEKHNTYQIFYTTRNNLNSVWNTPIALSDKVNQPGFNSQQPFITKDQSQLFFASDKPGGYGKYDIWMIKLDAGIPTGAAVNLGKVINTIEDDVSPFYDPTVGTLYFSSNGRTGMGGMDIYQINGDSKLNQWKDSAVNMGFPINSVKDDLYYSKESQSDTGYLSSDRASNCCMEVFKVVPLSYKDTISPATVQKQKKLPVIVPKTADTILAVQTEKNHLLDSVNEATIDRLHINYRFASARIRRADYPQLDRVIELLQKNPALHIMVASFTDCIGSKLANELIARKRSESVKAFLINKGIDPSRINIDFFGKKHLIVACNEDSSYHTEKQMANRRSDLIVTTEKNPKWKPSGKELDLQKIIPDSLLMIASDKNAVKKNNTDQLSGQSDIAKANQTQPAISKEELRANAQMVRSFTENDQKFSESKKSGSLSDAVIKMNGLKSRNTRITGNKDQAFNRISNAKRSEGKTAPTEEKTIKTLKATVPSIQNTDRKKSNGLHEEINISQLLDFTPHVKQPTVIEQMISRTPRKSVEVFTTSDSVKVELYDNGVFDYDTVSVLFNKELVIYKQLLQTHKPVSFYVKLSSDQRKNEMIFFAENLGLTPPNSALMVITDGDKKRTEINVSSDLEHNAVIYFIKVNK